MVEPLHVTSSLFATVVLHAYYRAGAAAYHHVFLLVTAFSVLFHTTHDPTVAVLDKLTAHAAFLVSTLDLPRAVATGHGWLCLFPAGVLALWVMEFIHTDRWAVLHAWLHAVSIVGVHAFLCALYGTHVTPVTPQPALDR